MIKDPVQVARAAARLEVENWRFRTYLKAFCIWSDHKLNRIAARIGLDAAGQIDCKTCAACCRCAVIPVTDEEVERLSIRLRLPVLDFRARFVRPADAGEPAIDGHPCPFLEGSHCGVYEDRPAPCREYPYIEGDVRSRMVIIIERAGVCPIVFEQVERMKDATGFRRLHCAGAAVGSNV